MLLLCFLQQREKNGKENKLIRLSSLASTRRLARLWVDLGNQKRKENLSALDSFSRAEVIARMVEIRKEREEAKDV